jgi:hypothetical protein
MPHSGTCVRHHAPDATPTAYPAQPTAVHTHMLAMAASRAGRRTLSMAPKYARSNDAWSLLHPRASGGGGTTAVTSGPGLTGFQPRTMAAAREASGTVAAPTTWATR